MNKLEVTPGMFSQAEIRPSWKTPIVLAFFALLVMVAFGFLGKPGDVTYNLSNKGDIFSVPDIVVASTFVNILLGSLMLALAGVSVYLTVQGKRTPSWLSLIAGLIGATALLGRNEGDKVTVTLENGAKVSVTVTKVSR